MTKKRNLMLVAALAAALVMLFALSSIAFASGDTPTDGPMVCVDGYVINHRELPVDLNKWATDEASAADAGGTLQAAQGGDGMAAASQPDLELKPEEGYFKFTNLPEGEWNFLLYLPTDWEGIVPVAARGGVAETGLTYLKAKEDPKDCYRIVFKVRRVFDVTVIKWEELLDGTVRPGVDWEITFTPVKDPFVKAQTKKTNESGAAVFTVTPGNWTISEKVKSGWKPITPSTVHLTLDQYAPPGAMDPVVFKNLQPPCKSSIVVEKTGLGRDANGGLVWLGPLAGWQVTVARADGGMAPVTKTTDASGKATFDGLLPGVYKVTEQMQIGWKAVSENPQTVVHMDCETTRVLFENEEIKGKLTIQGKKLFKAWEPPYKGTQVGLAGWVITATLTGTDAMTTTVTNALGEYQFSEEQLKAAGMGFPGATIQVCEEDRANWIHITPDCVNVKFPYPVPADYTGAVVNFTNIQDPPLPGTGGSTTVSGSCTAVHKVASGENLSSIAARYGTTVSALANANGIKNVNYVRSGQMLCIP